MSKKTTTSKPSFYGLAKLGERGQIVIPQELRKKLKLKKGDKFVVVEREGTIVLTSPNILASIVKDLTNFLKEV